MRKSNKDIYKSVRKALPPATRVHKSKKREGLEKIYKKEFRDAMAGE